MPSTDPAPHRVLSWLHIGDLHLTVAEAVNHRDLQRIVSLANALLPRSLDFALLPGDTAENGTPAQYRLAHEALAPLRLPLHILPGDHDMEPGSLHAFHAGLGAPHLPYASRLDGHRCLFLDLVSAGGGGPDFRMNAAQLAWLAGEIDDAAAAGEDVVVFQHTYPADLRVGGAELAALLRRPQVRCVDMGHTHYNELANDGGTIFMATRSTGQIEEGPPGFSLAALDQGVVSWRFRRLDAAWPCVLITHPADHRLALAPPAAEAFAVRAKVMGDVPIVTVEVQADDGDWQPMARIGPTLFAASGAPGATRLTVRARDAAGREDAETILPAGPGWTPPSRVAAGSDADRIGAWPEKDILGTQLGPNRNGRHW